MSQSRGRPTNIYFKTEKPRRGTPNLFKEDSDVTNYSKEIYREPHGSTPKKKKTPLRKLQKLYQQKSGQKQASKNPLIKRRGEHPRAGNTPQKKKRAKK